MKFADRSPAVVNMEQKLAAGAYDSSDVLEHLSSILTPLDHAQRAEQTDSMIGTVIAKAIQLNQVGPNRMDRLHRGIGGFFHHSMQHPLTQIDPHDRVATLGERQGGSPTAASEIQNAACTSLIDCGKQLVKQLQIESA